MGVVFDGGNLYTYYPLGGFRKIRVSGHPAGAFTGGISVYMSLSLFLCVCLSPCLCLSVCSYLSLCLSMSVCLSLSVSVCLSPSLSVCLSPPPPPPPLIFKHYFLDVGLLTYVWRYVFIFRCCILLLFL